MKWWQKASQSFNPDGIRLFAYILGVRHASSSAHFADMPKPEPARLLMNVIAFCCDLAPRLQFHA